MITAKTLPLVLKAAAASMPTSVIGQRPTIAMLTAINSQKAVIGSDGQSTAVNLQTTNKVANQGTETFQIVAKNAVTLVSDMSVCSFRSVIIMIWFILRKLHCFLCVFYLFNLIINDRFFTNSVMVHQALVLVCVFVFYLFIYFLTAGPGNDFSAYQSSPVHPSSPANSSSDISSTSEYTF